MTPNDLKWLQFFVKSQYTSAIVAKSGSQGLLYNLIKVHNKMESSADITT